MSIKSEQHILYNSAIGNRQKYFQEVDGLNYFSKNNNTIFCSDIIKFNLPNEYKDCDFLYADPPYPQGFKIFEERAKIKKKRTYNEFVNALNKIILNFKKPIFMTVGKILLKKLIKPKQIISINFSIHNSTVDLAIWNYYIEEKIESTNNLMKYLGLRFDKMGDFCCGYGDNIERFLLNGGKKFVASDLDSKCIAILKKRLFYDF